MKEECLETVTVKERNSNLMDFSVLQSKEGTTYPEIWGDNLNCEWVC